MNGKRSCVNCRGLVNQKKSEPFIFVCIFRPDAMYKTLKEAKEKICWFWTMRPENYPICLKFKNWLQGIKYG